MENPFRGNSMIEYVEAFVLGCCVAVILRSLIAIVDVVEVSCT
jgi:hypothetical protein